MCGIAAALMDKRSGERVDRAELILVRDAMASRGPDGEGVWVSDDGRVGLAHRRLSIIDLTESGAQPMAGGHGVLRIVFNGEIYNYKELRRQLVQKGHRFRSNSDTEVLLHLYQECGRDMVHHLRGMYAFALWDERRSGLLLGRDPLGIKPLYFSEDGHRFRAASQVKALLAGGRVDTRPEPAGHVGFFLWGFVPEPYTLFKGIRALPAGSTLWIDKDGRRNLTRFFNVSEELACSNGVDPTVGSREVHERLREALLDSVRHHLVADVPVGVFLSSGLDSSTLTALAAEAAVSDLRTVTLRFREYEGTSMDESALAERVAQSYGTVHHTHATCLAACHAELEQLVRAMDQPSIDGVNTYLVSKAAAQQGLKVAMSGLGGDELFGGYPSFRQIPKAVKAFRPFQVVPGLGSVLRRVSVPLMGHFASAKYAGLFEYGGAYGSAYMLRRSLFMPWELPSVLDGDLAREGWRRLKTIAQLEDCISGVKSERAKVCGLEMSWYLRNQLLRDADWAGLAHSVEIRVPFVDSELFRAAAPMLTAAHPPTKMDMAATPFKPLPSELMSRRKTGFSVPIQEWLVQESAGAPSEPTTRRWARLIYKRMVNAA